MSKDQEFTPMEKGATNLGTKKSRQKAGVIKSRAKHVDGTIHLKPQIEDTDVGVEFFQPILEGETIVGVLHKCSCGKTAEVRFQYADQ